MLQKCCMVFESETAKINKSVKKVDQKEKKNSFFKTKNIFEKV